jgi:AAA+ superfamily predicted ATPase
LQYGSTSFFVLFSLTCKSGPPGVGKTLTAEAVAELLQLPLYSVCFIVFRLLHLI